MRALALHQRGDGNDSVARGADGRDMNADVLLNRGRQKSGNALLPVSERLAAAGFRSRCHVGTQPHLTVGHGSCRIQIHVKSCDLRQIREVYSLQLRTRLGSAECPLLVDSSSCEVWTKVSVCKSELKKTFDLVPRFTPTLVMCDVFSLRGCRSRQRLAVGAVSHLDVEAITVGPSSDLLSMDGASPGPDPGVPPDHDRRGDGTLRVWRCQPQTT